MLQYLVESAKDSFALLILWLSVCNDPGSLFSPLPAREFDLYFRGCRLETEVFQES